MAQSFPLYLRLLSSGIWFMDARRAEVMVGALMARLENGPRATPFLSEDQQKERAMAAGPVSLPMVASGKGPPQNVSIHRLIGVVFPRGDLEDISGGGSINLARFQSEFKQAADDPNVGAIVLEIDSPGGTVNGVPETAAMVADAVRARPDRPVVAVANSLAASAAYWIASAASELVVVPSGSVGSIGVYMLHLDESDLAAAMGVTPTYIFEAPRKIEGHPFAPLDGEALIAWQAEVKAFFDMFVRDVAQGRHVSDAVVRRDPVGATAQHFGGGRSYGSAEAVRLGLADRIDTMQAVIQGLVHNKVNNKLSTNRRSKSAGRLTRARRRLAML